MKFGYFLEVFLQSGACADWIGNRENSNYKFQFLFFFLEKCDRQTDGHNNVWLGLSRVLLRNNSCFLVVVELSRRCYVGHK